MALDVNFKCKLKVILCIISEQVPAIFVLLWKIDSMEIVIFVSLNNATE